MRLKDAFRGSLTDPTLLRCLALGQLLSICIAATGVFSELLARQGVNTPTTQSAVNYALLSAVYGGYLVWRRRWSIHSGIQYTQVPTTDTQPPQEQLPHRPPILTQPVLVYALLALLDVEGNYLLVRAFQFTSLTSVTLLDCFTIPVVMALSTVMLGRRYGRGHVAGALLCVAGIALLVATDPAAGAAGYKAPLLGDVLVLLGACLYAVGNVAQEKLLVGSTAAYELLAMMGTCGLAISVVQVLVFETGQLAQVPWSLGVVGLYGGFAAAMFAFYSLVPVMLMVRPPDAYLWSAVARCVFFDGFPSVLAVVCFGAAVLVTGSGLVLYTWSGGVAEEQAPRDVALERA